MTNCKEKIVIYIDMDDTLCDYKSAFEKALKNNPSTQYPQSVSGFFLSLEPLQNAIETFQWLFEEPRFDVYILTAPSPKNPHCYTEKRLWVERYLGYGAVEKLIISPHKQLNRGAYLIDDCDKGKGQERFEGRLIRFGHGQFKNWSSVREYFEQLLQAGIQCPNKSSLHPDVLCFRSFDMRDRFSEPVATFREALKLLQSDKAYLPEWDSKIICYLRSGQSIPIPEEFYLSKKKRFSSRDAAEKWVRERAEERTNQSGIAFGLLISDPNLPIEEQINQAFAHHETEVIDSSENDRVCDELDRWLSAAIDNLPTKTINTAEDTSDKATVDKTKGSLLTETEIEGFKKMFEQVCGRSRWFIASNHATTEESGDVCYLDVSSNKWISDIQKATGFKKYYLAKIVCDGLDRDLRTRIVEFEVSSEYMAMDSIKIDVDRQVIGHHEPSQTFLYQRVGMETLDQCSVLLRVKDTKETFLDISALSGNNVTVGLTPDAMDALAIAWCKHRKLQGALGGPVGKEWGSPDCDYD